MKKVFLIFCALTLLISCKNNNKNSNPWIPVLEKSDFSYLTKAVDKCLETEKTASDSILSNVKNCDEEIKKAKNCILKLKNYYIPLTEVRQLVYDADRLYYLSKIDYSIKKLKKADEILLKIGESHPILKKHTADLIYANNNLIASIKNSPKEVASDFRKIAIEINLLLNKGELVLESLQYTDNQ